MKKISAFKKGLLDILMIATLAACNPSSNQKYISGERSAEKSHIEIKEGIKLKNPNKIPWTDVKEYDEFVQSTVNKYYASDIKEIYDFYNIKKDLPKYGFKPKEEGYFCIECEGSIYKEGVDSIYFYSGCSKDTFERYRKSSEKGIEKVKDDLTNRVHHYIQHEAAHSFYYELGKKLGENYLFNIKPDSIISQLESIQSRLVEEGVADYMSYKGELSNYAKTNLTDKNFEEMIKKESDYNLYELGFILVKPILDLNFEKGILELIKHPLTKEDLNDLPGYRAKRIENILKE